MVYLLAKTEIRPVIPHFEGHFNKKNVISIIIKFKRRMKKIKLTSRIIACATEPKSESLKET